MTRKLRLSAIKIAYIFIDIFFVSLAIYLASCIRGSSLPYPVTVYNLFINSENPFRAIFLFWILVTILLANSYGLYKTKREISEWIEVWQVIKSVFLAITITIVAIYLAKVQELPRSILGWSFFFISSFFCAWRVFKRFFVNWLVGQGYNNFNALIIGAGKIGQALACEIRQKPGFGIKIVGFLDDFKTSGPDEKGTQILGKISDFVDITRREFVNKVFITIHHDSRVFLQLLEQAKELGIAVRVVPQGFEIMPGEFCKYNIGFIPILEYCDAESSYKQVGKRLFDFFMTFLGAIFLLPVFVVIVVLIKIDSPGSVFYQSKRYGRKGRIFYMYKFRSMVCDADKLLEQMRHKNEVDGPIFKIKEDPRITRLGKFLRKYSLDELPQVFNVLKGDMSLVGPRPFPISQIEKQDLRQLARLEVRPGITGLWQIRGRSDLSFSRLVKWDVWYINNWSFWLDLNILVQTIPVVFKSKGAY